TLRNFKEIPQIRKFLSDEDRHNFNVVGNVLPFKVNNYVIDELIDWAKIPNDPIYQLTFPQKGMLSKEHFRKMENALRQNLDSADLKKVANKIRTELNPHPAGQLKNIPTLNGEELPGIQHKYRETVLFFPGSGQTCHAYCTFCFRWPQFVGMDNMKFAMHEADSLAGYVKQHPEVTDVLFTGGDPMVMSAKRFSAYIEPLINHQVPNLQTIRIGTKSLSYWPYKFLTDKDADEMLPLFEKIVKQGYHLAFMAHFNHPQELQTVAVKKAIKRIRATGAQIRTQSPIMKHINDNPAVWTEMWNKQVKLGLIPYYMFIARNTGAQDYFAINLERAWNIFRDAYQNLSGVGRTVRGPVMSANPGKVQILGINEIMGQKVFTLRFMQGRDSDWVAKPFFAEYDPDAIWLDDLKPAFDRENFFFEEKFEENFIELN
ncbi:MAG: lysine 2,3-aminomutase, partial [Bacteroidetes bacterium]